MPLSYPILREAARSGEAQEPKQLVDAQGPRLQAFGRSHQRISSASAAKAPVGGCAHWCRGYFGCAARWPPIPQRRRGRTECSIGQAAGHVHAKSGGAQQCGEACCGQAHRPRQRRIEIIAPTGRANAAAMCCLQQLFRPDRRGSIGLQRGDTPPWPREPG